jgi:hypothetical protein
LRRGKTEETILQKTQKRELEKMRRNLDVAPPGYVNDGPIINRRRRQRVVLVPDNDEEVRSIPEQYRIQSLAHNLIKLHNDQDGRRSSALTSYQNNDGLL